MTSFEQRARALISGLSATVKMMLPSALLDLLVDMCKALDKLNQEK